MYPNQPYPKPGGMPPNGMPPRQAYPPASGYGNMPPGVMPPGASPSAAPTHIPGPAPGLTQSTIGAIAPGLTQSQISQNRAPSPVLQRPKEKVQLFQGPREREKYDNMADLYAIIKTVEHLEKAYVKDAIPAEQYEPACTKLIAQYRTACGLVEMNVDDFATMYKLDCPAAMLRLKAGIPATLEHTTATGSTSGNQEAVVAQAVQHFITASDLIKLGNGDMGNVSVDQLLPYLRDLLDALNKMPKLPPDFISKEKIKEWIKRLTPQPASYQLTDEEVRQISFDLESAHDAFFKSLSSAN